MPAPALPIGPARTEILWFLEPGLAAPIGPKFEELLDSRWRVSCAETGPDAEAAIRSLKPDLLVLETPSQSPRSLTLLRTLGGLAGGVPMALISTGPVEPDSIPHEVLDVEQSSAVDVRWVSRLVRAARQGASRSPPRPSLDQLDVALGIDDRAQLLEKARTMVDRTRLWLVLVNLDRFRLVNENFGLAVGDRVLAQVARRMRAVIGETELAGRLGADEIAWFTTVDPTAASERLRQTLRVPYDAAGGEVSLTASVALVSSTTRPTPLERLLARGDAAIRRAKAAGGDVVVSDADENSNAQRWYELDTDLRLALERQELFLNYQPQLDLSSKRLSGFEALIRWRKSTGQLVSPGEFIPALESTGLIVPVGAWVMHQACTTMARWRSEGLADARIAVNVSAVQLRRDDFLGIVDGALLESGLPPECLELEITESLMVDVGTRSIHELLNGLRARGVRVAIDDFGTGYASMAYLRRLPIQVLKIDRSFVKELGLDPKAGGIVRAIVELARALNMSTVAEGVETTEQEVVLAELGCRDVQGFRYAKPMAEIDAGAWWRAHHQKAA